MSVSAGGGVMMEVDQANSLYREAMYGRGGMGEGAKCSYFERAIEIYGRCVKKGVHPSMLASLLKNLGMANLRLAQVIRSNQKVMKNKVQYHVLEAVGALVASFSAQEEQYLKVVGSSWRNKVDEALSEAFERVLDLVEKECTGDGPAKFKDLERITAIFAKSEEYMAFQIQFNLAKAHFFYKTGIKVMDKGDYKRPIQLLEYARQEINEVAMCPKKYLTMVVKEEIRSLEDGVSFLRCSNDSLKLRVEADELFDTHVLQSEDVNLEMMWEVLDMYKAAALCCREIDIENEAIALARQGRIFDKIFKIRAKAHDYYRAAFNLSQALRPGDFKTVGWLGECRAALSRFQQELLREEEAKREKEKAPYLAKMTKVLTDLKAIHNEHDPYKLLRYVYKNHPPKVEFVFDDTKLTADTAKKCLMTAISQYHPDKQMSYDMEWRILSEEITKCLTVRYESFKGVVPPPAKEKSEKKDTQEETKDKPEGEEDEWTDVDTDGDEEEEEEESESDEEENKEESDEDKEEVEKDSKD